MFLTSGIVPIVAAIVPYSDDRIFATSIIRPFRMIEVYVATPVDVCIARDDKGLYARARAGSLTGLAGFDLPYEPSLQPDVTINPAIMELEQSVARLLEITLAGLAPS